MTTVIGIVLPLQIDAAIGGMGWVVLGMLGLISLAALLQTRFLVLPPMWKAYREQGRPVTLMEFERSSEILIGAFSIAPAVYGVVGGVMIGAWWPALPFSAMAMVTLATLRSYATRELEALRREARARGE